MKCTNCDTINPDNARFCRNCGMDLQENDIPDEEVVHVATIEDDDYRQANTSSGNDGGSSTLIACCVIVVIIFIAFAIFSFF